MDSRTRDRIIEAAMELFNFRGYKNVTLREIAEYLGISKKTVYQFFSGKEQIAEEVLLSLSRRLSSRVLEIKNLDQDPVVKLQEIIKHARIGRNQVNLLFLEDIRKYIPNLQEKIAKIHQERMLVMETIIREGQEMGSIRRDIDPRMVAIVYYSITRAVTNPANLGSFLGYSPSYSSDKGIDFVVDVFLNGICNNK